MGIFIKTIIGGAILLGCAIASERYSPAMGTFFAVGAALIIHTNIGKMS